MEKQKQEVKKQHLVPQNYLKRFTSKAGHLRIFDKFGLKRYGCQVKDAAEMNRFYDLPEDILPEGCYNDKQIIERGLGHYEGLFAKHLAELIPTFEQQAINAEQRMAISMYMAIQLSRTRESRQMITEMTKRFTQATINNLVKRNFPDADEKLYPVAAFTDEYWREMQGMLMFDLDHHKKLSMTLFHHTWQLGINRTASPFYTSDHPVALYLPERYRSNNVRGIGSFGIQIAFPITPTYIILLMDRLAYADRIPFDGWHLILDEKQVESFNKQQVIDSYQQIICNEDDFDLAEKVCAEMPSICDPERQRWAITQRDEEMKTTLELRRID